MNYIDAKILYKDTFYGGRKKGNSSENYTFPFGKRYQDEEFIEIDLRIEYIDIRLRVPELVPKYMNSIQKGVRMPSVWITIGRKLVNGTVNLYWNRKIRVLDGFHRMKAHRELGIETVKAIIPKCEYELFKTLEVRNYELYSKN